MRMTPSKWFAALLLPLALFAGAALGAEKDAETPKDVDAATAKKALANFKRDFDTPDIDFQLDAVKRLGKVQHKSVANVLLKQLNSEDPHIRAAALEGLSHQYSSAKKVGAKADKLLKDTAEHPRVIKAGVVAIGNLEYTRGRETLEKAIDHDDDDVVAATFTVFGKWKDDSAANKMLLWWEFFPDEKDFRVVSVKVDTGTAGSGDQKAAERKGRAALSKAKSWRPRNKCTKALRKALKEIYGVGFIRPSDLREYLDAPKKYKDPTLVAERVDEPKRRAIYAQYAEALKQALVTTDEKMPPKDGDPANARERGKLYKAEVYAARRKLSGEHDLTVSELLVIRYEGDEKEWGGKK